MAVRTLSERELNRALLARQFLLERAGLPLTRVIERMGGVQTQYAPSGYIGLWSRIAAFERRHLTRALERRVVVQGTLMRSTIHMVTARDYALLAEGTRQDRRTWSLGATRRQFPELRMEAVARDVRALLSEGPRRRADLVAALGVVPTVWNGVGAWIDLLRVPPSGTWEQRRGASMRPRRIGSVLRSRPSMRGSSSSSAGTSVGSARRRARTSPAGRACRCRRSRPCSSG